MTAVRQDAWSTEDDLILAEVTLRHIREGSTQSAAFEEVGEKIGRTSAACGFRWNSCVRKKYDSAISNAKAQRQKRSYLRKQPAMLGPQVEHCLHWTLKNICTNQMGSQTIHYRWMQ